MPESRSGLQVVFTGPGSPLSYVQRAVQAPRPGEILVRMSVAGVCGTDVHRLAGDIHDSSGPVCFGHEGVGSVEELGDGVSTDTAGEPLRVGDRVQWSPIAPCNRCYGCTVAQDPVTCENRIWPLPAADANPATFQEFATIPATGAIYRLSDDADFNELMAFGCALPTAIAGIARLGRIEPGQTVVIQGSGPVGLAATVLAGLSHAREVIVIGDPAVRLRAAVTLGATRTLALVDTTPGERRSAVLEATSGRGADIVIEAAGQRSAISEGLNLLGRNGRYLIMGLYSGAGEVPVDFVRLNNMSQRLIGTLAHQVSDIRLAADVATRHGARLGFAQLITHRFPLGETETAIRAVAREDAIKVVVDA